MTLPSGKGVQIVFSDVDGTLLDSAHRVPSSLPAVAQQLRSRGVQLVLSTGKTRTCLSPVLQELFPAEDPNLAAGLYINGCSMFGPGGETLGGSFLSEGTVRAACEAAEALGRDVVAFCDGDALVSPDPQAGKLAKDILKYGEKPPSQADIRAKAGELRVHKLLVWHEGEQSAECSMFMGEIERRFPGHDCLVTAAVPNMLEVVTARANKGTAVLHLLSKLGLTPENALCFGDGLNDLPMFEALGKGRAVAMKNAVKDLKSAADYETSTTNDEEGLTLALRTIFELDA
eukprot:Hpha_TRINITY_DN18655_c0_g1::TRINITY_DN18655_c0_g1_i1::g.115729::m.115729